MRVNVYSEELTEDVAIVEKNGHFGLRFNLASAPALHYQPDDDDRSAVTFWGLRAATGTIAAAIRALDIGGRAQGVYDDSYRTHYLCPYENDAVHVAFQFAEDIGRDSCAVCGRMKVEHVVVRTLKSKPPCAPASDTSS